MKKKHCRHRHWVKRHSKLQNTFLRTSCNIKIKLYCLLIQKLSSCLTSEEIILNGHAIFGLARRGYLSLPCFILKLNQEHKKRLYKVGHCLQKSSAATVLWEDAILITVKS